MNLETEQRLRDWLTDRAGSDITDLLMQRVNALPNLRPARRSRVLPLTRPFGGRPTIARISSAAAAIVVIVALATGGILLSRPDGPPPGDPALGALRDPSPARSPMLGGSPKPTVAASPGVSITPAQLDQLYSMGAPETITLWEFDAPTDIKAMTVVPDDGVYFIAPAAKGRGDSVFRLNRQHDRVYEIIRTGDSGSGGSREVGRPRLLAMTALKSPELLIVDDNGQLWRWRQYGDKADGTLAYRRVLGDVPWGDDVRDISTLVTHFARGLYNLYVLDPDSDQILKYPPTLDFSRFAEPERYLVTADESVADYIQLYIDGNLYTLTPDNVVKHTSGRKVDWAVDDPPDGDLRPGHRYRFIDGSGAGRLFVYDELWDRILVFAKQDGSYIEQWATSGSQPSMADVRGMDASQGGTLGRPRTARITWVTPQGIYRSTLTQATDGDPSGTLSPEGSPGAAE